MRLFIVFNSKTAPFVKKLYDFVDRTSRTENKWKGTRINYIVVSKKTYSSAIIRFDIFISGLKIRKGARWWRRQKARFCLQRGEPVLMTNTTHDYINTNKTGNEWKNRVYVIIKMTSKVSKLGAKERQLLIKEVRKRKPQDLAR